MRNLVKWIGLLGVAGSGMLAAACGATADGPFGSGGSASTSSNNGGAGQGGNSTGQAGNDGVGGCFLGNCSASGGNGGGGTTTCVNDPNVDDDMDGFNETQGDCNDCDVNVSPESVEVTGNVMDPMYNPSDENCNGMVDEPGVVCDGAIAVDTMDPLDAARAVELCKMSAPGSQEWGVISAQWVMPDGSAAEGSPNYHLGHGVLNGFGPNVTPRAGSQLFGVSSGTARQPTDPGYSSVGGFNKNYTAGHPQGFPKESPACPGVTTGTPHDATAVEIQIRAPKNAKGFSFDFDFYTYEWPGFICSQYNDFFVAILSPVPVGQTDGQISFDAQGNPISVNNAFMNVCGCAAGPPCLAGGKSFDCPLGTNELMGTGFMDDFGTAHAATSWLKTQAPVSPGEVITIRWGAYDSGDGVLDSTALVDNWQWSAEAGTTVGTTPIEPPPK